MLSCSPQNKSNLTDSNPSSVENNSKTSASKDDGDSQTKRELIEFTGKAERDIHNYFTDGVVVADIMEIKPSFRLLELSLKLKIGISKNQEWFIEYLKTVPEGEPMPYHPNMGMPEEEYNEFLQLSGNMEVMSMGQENLEIKKGDTFVTFRGTGKLSLFDNVKIDLKNNQIYYKDYILAYEKETIVEDDSNGFKSKWKGYIWRYTLPDDIEDVDFTDLSNLSITNVKFTVGQLESNGRIYLKLKEEIVENGVKIEDDELQILFWRRDMQNALEKRNE